MGQNKPLDINNKTWKEINKASSRDLKPSLPLLIITCCLTLFYSCALPRIIILEDPLTPEEHINLGVAYEKKGQLDLAIKEYESASKKLPLGYLYLGNIYFQKNDFDKAEKCYRKGIAKDPRNSDNYNNLAWLYYTKRENLEEAENLAIKAVKLGSSREDIYKDTLEKIMKLKEPFESKEPVR